MGDFPEINIAAARKLADLIKADNAQGKDPIAAAEKLEEKTLDDVVQEYLIKKRCTSIELCFVAC